MTVDPNLALVIGVIAITIPASVLAILKSFASGAHN